MRGFSSLVFAVGLLAASYLGCDSPSGMPPPRSQPDMATPAPVLPTVADALHSGARLKVAYYTTTDGLTFPGGLIDLDVGPLVCAPRLASDGKLRCLPLFFDTPTQYFADAACTQPIYARVGEMPQYMTLQTADGGEVFFPFGFPEGLSNVYFLAGSACNSRSTPNGLSTLHLFTVGAPVTIDTFAEVQLSRGM